MLSQRKYYTMLRDGIITDPFIKMNRSIFFKYMQAQAYLLKSSDVHQISFSASPDAYRLSPLPQLINDF